VNLLEKPTKVSVPDYGNSTAAATNQDTNGQTRVFAVWEKPDEVLAGWYMMDQIVQPETT